ncbi:hypothetical protein GCM10010430_49900 [Kitasatospora cystarginea]|uniref:Uncharacterized protein n=1 Tax=Kitasatospora cystarginea TaxID=58350 RepID=A0ABP5RER7_9ACTN
MEDSRPLTCVHPDGPYAETSRQVSSTLESRVSPDALAPKEWHANILQVAPQLEHRPLGGGISGGIGNHLRPGGRNGAGWWSER